MLTDPIADMATRIRNALMVRKDRVSIPYSKFKEAVLRCLKGEGFIWDVEIAGEGIKKSLVAWLKYVGGEPVIHTLTRVSRPGRRCYSDYLSLKPLRGGLGVRILTTPKGIFSDRYARQRKVGGEILLQVW